MPCKMCSLGYLPVSLVILTVATVITSYIVAVVRNDVSAAFPYISDTGAEIPESCIFGQFFNLAAFLSMLNMYVRYKVVATLVSEEERAIHRANWIALILAVLSSLGCSMVANFQEGTIVEPVHFIGAFMVFGFGIIYTIVQTYISYKMHPNYCGLPVCHVRCAIAVISVIAFIITFVAGYISRNEWNKVNPDKSKFKWNVNDPGYAAHVVSTAGEWLTAFSFLSFFLTYAQDFHKFELTLHTQPLVGHLDDEPYMHQPIHQPRTSVSTVEERTPLLK